MKKRCALAVRFFAFKGGELKGPRAIQNEKRLSLGKFQKLSERESPL